LARLILDSSVLIAAERGDLMMADVIDKADDVAIAALTVAELRVGVGMADGRRRAAHEQFVAAAVEAIAVEVYDLDVASAHAELLVHLRRSGTPRGAHDLIIAATASATARSVVTFDRRCFADLPGVDVLELGEPA
jgi:tRNA(fMet)-specific endonuclease VapC